MKKIFICLLFIIFSCGLYAETDEKLIVYYFHGDYRCQTCTKMEQYSRQAIEENFKDKLNSGELVYKVVNVENKESAHFVKDYELYTKSLVLSLVKGDKEIRYKNLDKIWEYVRDKKKFMDYVNNETRQFLNS